MPPHAPPAKSQLIPYLMLAGAILFWAGNFTVGRAMHNTMGPLSLTFWRWLVALLLYLPFSLPAMIQQRSLILRHLPFLFFLSIPGIAIFHSFVYIALTTTTVINASLVMAFSPLFIVALSWGIFGERIRALQTLGIFISLAGVLFLITQGSLGVLLNLQFNPGDLWALGAVPAWGIYSVLLKLKPPSLKPNAMLGTLMICGVVVLAPFFYLEIRDGMTYELTWATGGSVFYMGFFASILAYIFWNGGVAAVGVNKAGLFLNLMPVFSAVLAIGFLGERFETYHFFGIPLVFLGVYLNASFGGTSSPGSDPP